MAFIISKDYGLLVIKIRFYQLILKGFLRTIPTQLTLFISKISYLNNRKNF